MTADGGAGAAMSTFIEVIAWLLISYAALPILITVLDLATGLQVKRMRHGRARTMGEMWPDVRVFVPILAIGIAMLAHQWNFGTARWWLVQSPLIAVGAMYFAAWIKSRMVNRPARPAAESNLRDSLVILAIGVSLVALVSKIDTVGRLANIPEFAIGALSLATWIKSRRQHPPGNPAAR